MAGMLNLHNMPHAVLDRLFNELVCMSERLPNMVFFFIAMEASFHYSNWLEFKLIAASERHRGPVGSILNYWVPQQGMI